jgi:hypothetical protein
MYEVVLAIVNLLAIVFWCKFVLRNPAEHFDVNEEEFVDRYRVRPVAVQRSGPVPSRCWLPLVTLRPYLPAATCFCTRPLAWQMAEEFQTLYTFVGLVALMSAFKVCSAPYSPLLHCSQVVLIHVSVYTDVTHRVGNAAGVTVIPRDSSQWVSVLCAQVFRYLGISKNMNALWLTLFRASRDLVAFGLGFLVIVMGFALMCNFMFGSALHDFHNVSASFSSLMRYPLGDFNYKDLSQARDIARTTACVCGPFGGRI